MQGLTRFLGVVLVVVLLGTIVTPTAAVPVETETDSPDTATPGETVTVTYELTNDGDEPSSALGIELQSGENLSVTAIDADGGTTAPKQNAVFWTEPVDAGESVAVSFELEVDANATAGQQTVEATVSSGTNSTTESATIDIDPAEEQSDETTNSTDDRTAERTGQSPIAGNEPVLFGVAALVVVLVLGWRAISGGD